MERPIDASSLRKWKKNLYPALIVITIVLFCKTILFQHLLVTIPSILPLYDSSIPVAKKLYEPPKINTNLKTNIVNQGNHFLNVSTSPKVAVIIETRSSGYIVPLILHFSVVLGPSWPIIIYTEAENFGSFSTSASFLRSRYNGRITVRSLPEGAYFPNWGSVSAFLTSAWLWNDLAPAEHVLMFQGDSIICSNAVRSLDDFFEWDLIGAPIASRWGEGYNGGLSLRKRSTVLRVLSEWEYNSKSKPHPEDQWFYARMKDLKERDEAEGVEDGIKLPSLEIARTFAVETIDYPTPIGFHQPTRFLKKHMNNLDDYCPEYKLATKVRIRG